MGQQNTWYVKLCKEICGVHSNESRIVVLFSVLCSLVR
jgi:hypothetical protein